MIDVLQLKKWSYNTKNSHRARGLPIKATPTEIFQETFNTLIQTQGCCPECGQPIRFGSQNWISLEYINSEEFEIICIDCNTKRNIQNMRKKFNKIGEGK